METRSRSVKQVIEPQYVIEGAGVLLRRSFGKPEIRQYIESYYLAFLVNREEQYEGR